jgi:hypothetical protein
MGELSMICQRGLCMSSVGKRRASEGTAGDVLLSKSTTKGRIRVMSNFMRLWKKVYVVLMLR